MSKNNKIKEDRPNIIIRFFQKLLDPTQFTSIKSLAMLVAMVISFGLSICLGYSMILDARMDGVLNMDLIDAGVFVGCLGSFMSLASIPKVLVDRIRAQRGFPSMHEEYKEEDEYEEKNED